jgi:hypothetical protein
MTVHLAKDNDPVAHELDYKVQRLQMSSELTLFIVGEFPCSIRGRKRQDWETKCCSEEGH